MSCRAISLVFLCVLACLVAPSSHTVAQEKRLLLFAKETTFLPEIVQVLTNMHSYKTGEQIFSTILNVNKWAINRLEEGEIDNLIRYYESSDELRKRSQAAAQRDDSLLNLIRRANCYMRIDVKTILPLLEFQMLISDSLPATEAGEFTVLVTNTTRLEGFVIDISKADFMIALVNSVKRLFPECNSPPTAVVRANNGMHNDGYYYYGAGRTIVLDASWSYDSYDDPDELQFNWKQVNALDQSRPVVEKNKVPLVHAGIVQRFEISDTGEYRFELTVSDGVSWSEKNPVKIRVLELPRIVAKPLYKITSNRSVFSKNSFAVPVQLVTMAYDSTEIRIASVQVRKYRHWHDFFIDEGEFDYLNVSEQNYSTELISSDADSTDSTNTYNINIRNCKSSGRYFYRIRLVAENEYVTGDTVEISVDYKGMSSFETHFVLLSTGYINVPGSNDDTVSFRKVYFGQAFTLSLGRDLSLTMGFLNPVYEEEHPDIPQSFDFPKFILVNYDNIWCLAYYKTGIYSGFGQGLNLGAIIDQSIYVEYIYYPRGWSSASMRVDLRIPGDIQAAFIIIWTFIMYGLS